MYTTRADEQQKNNHTISTNTGSKAMNPENTTTSILAFREDAEARRPSQPLLPEKVVNQSSSSGNFSSSTLISKVDSKSASIETWLEDAYPFTREQPQGMDCRRLAHTAMNNLLVQCEHGTRNLRQQENVLRQHGNPRHQDQRVMSMRYGQMVSKARALRQASIRAEEMVPEARRQAAGSRRTWCVVFPQRHATGPPPGLPSPWTNGTFEPPPGFPNVWDAPRQKPHYDQCVPGK